MRFEKKKPKKQTPSNDNELDTLDFTELDKLNFTELDIEKSNDDDLIEKVLKKIEEYVNNYTHMNKIPDQPRDDNIIKLKTWMEYKTSGSWEEYRKPRDFINEIKRIRYLIHDRKIEGDFINSELDNLRKDMVECMLAKTDGHIFTAPLTDQTDCFCNDQEVCFTIKKQKRKSVDKLDSQTFRLLYKQLEGDTVDPTKRIEFLKKMQLTVFTVFNLNDNTDNPPSITYVSTYPDDKSHDNKELFNKEFGIIEPAQTTGKYKIDGTMLLADNSVPNMGILHKTISSSISAADSVHAFKKNKMNSGVYEQVVPIIDKHNAATSMGTLVFTDTMSKFGNTGLSVFDRRECIKYEIPTDYSCHINGHDTKK